MKKTITTTLALSALATFNLNAAINIFTNESLFHASSSQLTNIDFDTFNGGDILTGNEFTGQGLTITHRDGESLQIYNGNIGFTRFHALNINTNPNGLSTLNGDNQNMDFTFNTGMAAAGLWIGNIADQSGSDAQPFNADSNGSLVQFIGTSGDVVAEEFVRTDTAGIIQSGASANNRIFIGAAYSSVTDQTDLIKTIRVFEGINDADGIVFDNIQYSNTIIPEPAALGGFFGLAALLIARRRV